jgi:hypothetical protein
MPPHLKASPQRPNPISPFQDVIAAALSKVSVSESRTNDTFESLKKAVECLTTELREFSGKLGRLEPSLSGINKELEEHVRFIKLSSAEEKTEFQKMVVNLGGTHGELSKVQTELSLAASSLSTLATNPHILSDSEQQLMLAALVKLHGKFMSNVLEIALGNMTALPKGLSESVEQARSQAKHNIYRYQNSLSHASSTMMTEQIASYLMQGSLDQDNNPPCKQYRIDLFMPN